MQMSTKTQIAKATLTALTVVASIFFIGIMVFVLCAGFQINPFKETTTEFLLAAFAGLIGIASILVLLNIAANISLIADSKIAALNIEAKPRLIRRWILGFMIIAVITAGFIFTGTYLSKKRFISVVHSQADEVLKENNPLLEEISRLLVSGKVADYKRIQEITRFLENQRSNLPNITLIYSGKFADKTAFYTVHDYFPVEEKNAVYQPPYFTCTANRDCDYLKQFFSGENADVLREYSFRSDQFYIYVPYIGKESRFVICFSRENRYGKIGS
jgi:hypothetical protein